MHLLSRQRFRSFANALSVPGGKLHIHWRCLEQHVELKWLESNGPRVEPPTRRGFGSKLLQEILTQDPEWSVEVVFEPSGVAARVTLHISAAIAMEALRLAGSPANRAVPHP
jgi:two-component sensor histidine kinase